MLTRSGAETYLQPPAVEVDLGLIRACLDLAGVRALIVAVSVRAKLRSADALSSSPTEKLRTGRFGKSHLKNLG
jgi:hypothetical protein